MEGTEKNIKKSKKDIQNHVDATPTPVGDK